MASTTEPEPSPKDEQKVPLAIESAVYWTKVLDYAFKDNKKWILQAAEPSPKSIIFSSMFNNKENSDVTFKVGDKEYHLHRAYVGEWSPIFKKMFLEKESETHQVIELKTSSAHSSRMYDNMFRFMYFDYISVPTSDFLPMLALACKYQIQALVAECSNMAPELIKLKQALSLVEQVHKHYTPEMQPLVDKCNEMICHEFERVYKKGSWFRLSKEALLGILDRNDVCADEYEVFEAVKKWCAHSEDRSAYLDELLTHVRFPTMDPKKIALLDKDPIFSKSKVLEGFQLEALKYCANPAIAKKAANPKKFESRWYASVEESFKYDPANEVIKTYVIPANGYYRFVAKGAKALDGTNKKGGRGAIIEATFFLKRGDKLEILVGGMSKRRSSDTGGGGGTFVAINGRKNPLIVAGGGGGTRGSTGDQDGRDASITPDGTDGAGTYCSKGATGGQGATGCTSSYGGGGGGFLSDGKPNGSGTTPGIGFINGGKSTPYGGFGGGGDAGNSGGGGGGGYSGGGAGQGAGGGGSFIRSDGTNVKKVATWESNGELSIKSTRKDG